MYLFSPASPDTVSNRNITLESFVLTDFTDIYTTAGATGDVVDKSPPSNPTPAPSLPVASVETKAESQSPDSSETPNPIPASATSSKKREKIKGPTAADHCNYVFGTWRVSKRLNRFDCLKVEKFLLQYDVTVACLQEVKFEQAKVTTTSYHWHIIKPHADARSEWEQIKTGGAILVRQSLMRGAVFKQLRSLTTVHLTLFCRPLNVGYVHVPTEGFDGIPDQEIIELQNSIETMNAKKRTTLILLGHFNAQIGMEDSGALQGLVGEHLAYRFSDRNGQVLKEILQSHQLKLISSFGPCPSARWTCTEAGQQEQVVLLLLLPSSVVLEIRAGLENWRNESTAG